MNNDHFHTHDKTTADPFYKAGQAMAQTLEDIVKMQQRIAELENENAALKEEQRWRKYPEEKPVAEIETRINLLAVIEYDNEFSGRKGTYVAEVYYVLYEDDVGVFYGQTGDETDFNIEHDGKRYSSKVVLWKPLPKAPEE